MEQDQIHAYLRFLSQYPAGPLAERARQRVQELQFTAALQADRPIGYQTYLQQHPDGKHVEDCRRRLAKLALKRARTEPQLVLILERYPNTPQAEQAALALPKVRARAALTSEEPERSRSFLMHHPEHPMARRVRMHLAELLSRSLPAEQGALESFAQQFAGTPPARRALQRLEALLAEEIRHAGEDELLQQFKLRFPSSSSLPELTLAVRQKQLSRAFAEVDTGGLAALASAAGPTDRPELLRLVRRCKADRPWCERLRRAARRAGPWRPEASLQELHQQAYDPDMMIAWRAILTLGQMTDSAAGVELMEMAGSGRFSMIWAADLALARWLARRSPVRRQGWATRQLRRSFRQINEDEAQRRGYLELIASRGEQGHQRLERLLALPQRALSVSYLLLRHEQRRGNTAPQRLLKAFLRAARGRTVWLKEAFPGELNSDSLISALLAERELFAIWRALSEAAPDQEPPEQGGSKVGELKREVAALLGQWQVKIKGVSKTYHPASHELIGPEAAAHEQGRAAALLDLRTRKGSLGKCLARHICTLFPGGPCTSILPASAKGL